MLQISKRVNVVAGLPWLVHAPKGVADFKGIQQAQWVSNKTDRFSARRRQAHQFGFATAIALFQKGSVGFKGDSCSGKLNGCQIQTRLKG